MPVHFHRHIFPYALLTLILGASLMGCSKSKKSHPDADSATGFDTASDTQATDSGVDSDGVDSSLDTADSDVSTDTENGAVTFEMQNQTVFTQNQVLEYHITIDPDELAAMDEFGNDEEYHLAALHVIGDGIDQQFDEIGVRYKGAWSLHHCWDENDGVRNYADECARLSMKMKFDKYDDDARLYGLKRLNFHSMMSDTTKLRERLSYSLFNDFGVVAPRTAHAKIYINGELNGIYIAVENVDGRFTHFNFPDGGNGNLFKELWPGPNVNEDWALTQLETNDAPEDNPDVSDFLAFKDAIDNTTTDDFESAMADWLDLDNIVRYLAVDRAIRNWDGIMGFYSSETSHNFYWYHDDGETDIFHLIPWDLDNTMGEFDYFMDPQDWCVAEPLPNWNETPADCMPRTVCFGGDTRLTPPRCDHLIDMLALTQWDHFQQRGNEFLADVFSYENMKSKITAWAEQIADAVAEDPMIDVDSWENEVAYFDRILKDAISDFQAHLDEGLIDEPVIERPDEALLLTPTDADGLRVDTVNNFEITPGTKDAYDDYLYGFASEDSVFDYEWHTDTPITGNGDLQFTVNFVSTDGEWSEWAGYVFAVASQTDLTPYTRMWLSVSANVNTRLRVEFRSNNYGDYGDIYEMFSSEFAISTEPTFYRIELKDLIYPDWARDNWEEGEGWTTVDSEILPLILSDITGIGFEMFPSWDSSGNMTEAEEQVVVHIDNIYFE
ncbi:MAG: CotH kinase family protein [Deltaproteobacteria bacterium]|nr:CotH kinase family protein [Deltaproteobacteria bacterium]